MVDDILHSRPISEEKIERIINNTETKMTGKSKRINGFDVFNNATFRVVCKGNDGWIKRDFNKLKDSVEWAENNHPDSPHSYEGWSESSPNPYVQSLPLGVVERF